MLCRYYEQIIVRELGNHDYFVHLETTLLLNCVVVCLLDRCTVLYLLCSLFVHVIPHLV